ncbi:MAG: sigma-54 dependent transcriptional regulator [bacterium]
MSLTILLVDDDKTVTESFKLALEKDYVFLTTNNGKEAIEIINKHDIDLVLLDIKLPDVNGMELLPKIKEIDERIEVIIITGYGTVDSAIQAMKAGAYDYICKPINANELFSLICKVAEKRNLVKEVNYLRLEVIDKYKFDQIIGNSPNMKQLYNVIAKVAKSDVTVHITGETGTGKDLVARAIHNMSNANEKPHISINCAAIPPELIESELFGHEKGSFTGAIDRKLGKFELADGGSIFLDEIGTLPLNMQAKLLRILQEKEFYRVGGTTCLKIKCRIISATNIDLKEAIKQGTFREDLFYRLNVLPLAVPPLRERREDIPLLTNFFIKQCQQSLNKSITKINLEIMDYFISYDWPGNVRELRNVIERMMVLEETNILTCKYLPMEILIKNDTNECTTSPKITYFNMCHKYEQKILITALTRQNWNQTKAAKYLGIHRNTLIKKMKKFNLSFQRT